MTDDLTLPEGRVLAAARAATAAFFGRFRPADRLVVFCHFDADGLAAGAVFGRALGRLGFSDVRVVASGRGESAFSAGGRERLEVLTAGLVVTDLGVNGAGVLVGVPTLFVDHHRPEGIPAGATVVSGYGWEPVPTSAWLAFELMLPLVDMDGLGWIAAVGVLSDLGDKAPWPRLPELKKRYMVRWLKEAVALVNAARRAAAFDVETPLSLLLDANSPKELAEDPRAERLQSYRAEVNAALALARRAAPVFAQRGPFVLLKLDSPVQLHPLIAQGWRGRLPEYAVIAANRGYLPGVVAFSARTLRDDLKLPEIFRSVDLGGDYAYGHGHDRASGGHLPVKAFNRLLSGLGFGENAFFSEEA